MATQDEILALEQLHRAAQARLGLAAAYLSLVAWGGVSALHPAETSAEWMSHTLRAITAVRKMSRDLAVSYYQLARALGAGRTLGVPEGSTPGGVTLGVLRKNFRDRAIDVASIPSGRTRSTDPDIQWFEDTLKQMEADGDSNSRSIRFQDSQIDPLIQHYLGVEGPNDSDPVPVDPFDWAPDKSLEDVTKAYEDVLRQHAIKRSTESLDKTRSDTTLTPDQAIKQIEETHAGAGSIGSGTADAAGTEGGRDVLDQGIRSDKLVQRVARETSGDPCYLCAMLASRGFVYRSEASAMAFHHLHCHCFPIVRFELQSSLPPLNSYFQAKWKEVTAGYSGKGAIKAFRRWIYAQRKADPLAPHGVPKTA